MGDKVMGPNCVHEKAVTMGGVSATLSTAYRMSSGKKTFVWGEEVGVIVESDAAHLTVLVGTNKTSYAWTGSHYEEP
jgi:hypothetical protein